MFPAWAPAVRGPSMPVLQSPHSPQPAPCSHHVASLVQGSLQLLLNFVDVASVCTVRGVNFLKLHHAGPVLSVEFHRDVFCGLSLHLPTWPDVALPLLATVCSSVCSDFFFCALLAHVCPGIVFLHSVRLLDAPMIDADIWNGSAKRVVGFLFSCVDSMNCFCLLAV